MMREWTPSRSVAGRRDQVRMLRKPRAVSCRALLLSHCLCALLFLAVSPVARCATLNLSQDLVALGISATNMLPNQPAQDSGPLLVQGVEYAKTHGITNVVANQGTYYFLNTLESNAHVGLRQIDNMTIDFHGADLIFAHPLYYGIIVYYSTNAVLQNFTADYRPLPFTQVRVDAIDVPAKQIQYTVQSGWAAPATLNSISGPGGLGPALVDIHVFRHGRPILGRLITQLPLGAGHLQIVDSGLTPAGTLAAVRPGDIAVVALKDYATAVNANHCVGCTLRNISVFSAANAGVQAIDSTGNLLERVYSIPKPGTDRLVSTFGIATFPMLGPDNRIRLSRAIGTMDDALAMVGQFVGTVQDQANARTLLLQGSGGPSILDARDSVPNGAAVAFQRLSDGVILGNAVIVSQTSPSSSPPYQVAYTFDRDLPGGLIGSVMYTADPALNNSGTTLERSTVQGMSCCKAVYLGGFANGTVRGNYLRRSAWSGVFLVQATAPGDPPTPPLTNLDITNNVIDGSNMKSDWWWFEFAAIQSVTLTTAYDLMAHSVFSNINVTNNFIADSGRSGVWLGNTSGGSIAGNYILDPNRRPDLANAYQPRVADAFRPLVVDTTSSGVTVASNTIDNTSGTMFVTDIQDRELAAYSPGATIRLSAHNLGTLPNPSITLTDADGNKPAVVIQRTTTHALDVQLPTSAALGGAYVTLTSGSAKYFGTLFVDSQDHVPAVNGCTYEPSASSTSVPDTGGTVSILVVTQAGCAYTAVDPDAFVTLGGGGTGTSVITVGLAANTGGGRNTTLEIAGIPVTLYQAGNMPGASTIVGNPYGNVSVQGGTRSGYKISSLQPDAVIQLGTTPGTAGSFAEIDFQTLAIAAGNTLTVRSGAPGQALVLYNASSTPGTIAGTLQAEGGNGAPPPVLILRDPNGVDVASGARVSAPAGLTVDTLGVTPAAGKPVTNAGVLDGGASLTLRGGRVTGGGAFKGDSTFIGVTGHANNTVNGAHFLANGVQLYPSTGGNVDLTLNAYGATPQVLNLMINGNGTVWMPSAWPTGATVPANNAVIPPGGSRPAGAPEPAYGGGSIIVQAQGSLQVMSGPTRDFAFPGAIALKSGGTLDLNGVVINQGWTITGKQFQGVFFESPDIVSPAGLIQVLTNNPNWINFSTLPQQHVRTWSLAPNASGGASYIVADSFATHVNSYSATIEAAANGECWTCLINPAPVDMR